jgi:ankyrin repeat protein
MKRTKDDLKREFSINKKILDKLKKETIKLLKNVDRDSFNHSSAIARAAQMIHNHDEKIELQLEIAQELVVMGEDKNGYIKHNLFENVKNGDCAAIATSYINGGSIETTDKDNWTPLHLAALNGHYGIAEFLLKMGAEVDSKNSLKRTPLHIAASHDKKGVAKVLLTHGANPFLHSKNKECPQAMAVSLEMKKILMEAESNFIEKHITEPNQFLDHCDTILTCAVQHKNARTLILLLPLHKKGFKLGLENIDSSGNNALHVAVANDDDETLKQLLTTRPFPFRKNKQDKYPIQLAESKKIKSIMEKYEQDYILEITGSPHLVKNMGGELLLYCAEKGYLEAVEKLIPYTRNGLVDINISDLSENTPLHIAVKYRHENIAAILLRNGADMMVVNKFGNMPADYIKDHRKLIRIFNNSERMWVNRVLQQYFRSGGR